MSDEVHTDRPAVSTPLTAENLRSKVVVAMSGGVDSCVAALLLRQAGHEVVGISMQVWDYRNHGGSSSRATCCAPNDFNDARRVAAAVGIPYYVFDFEKNFRQEVIDPFVQYYQAGLTPNPCVDCNSKVKFRELRSRVMSLGVTHVATGHYARITKSSQGYHLRRGKDLNKDQSYFLYGLSQEELATTLFPVGEYTKSEVRTLARAAGLVTADKAESQDICFVSGSVQDLVVKLGGKRPRGKIRSSAGEVLGEHEGLTHYTVGQRRGLGVGGTGQPLYVIDIDTEQNELRVGTEEELKREEFWVRDLHWVAPTLAAGRARGERVTLRAIAQLRYRASGVEIELEELPEGIARVRILSGWTTVTPGQACVLYDLNNEELLGGGRIAKGRLSPN